MGPGSRGEWRLGERALGRWQRGHEGPRFGGAGRMEPAVLFASEVANNLLGLGLLGQEEAVEQRRVELRMRGD